jgi:hypothetical protein
VFKDECSSKGSSEAHEADSEGSGEGRPLPVWKAKQVGKEPLEVYAGVTGLGTVWVLLRGRERGSSAADPPLFVRSC